MKRLFYSLGLMVALTVVFTACEKNQDPITPQEQDAPLKASNNGCTTIQSGELVNSAGDVIETGYDDFGYNYQAHMYNGDYYGDGSHLVMKWNDAWLSNKDCGTQPKRAEYTDVNTPDNKLDRHYPLDTYIGSGAWLTNHYTKTYYVDGVECEYDEFIKIIAVPADATKTDGIWYNADGVEIGPVIWGSFAIIQEVINDPCAGVEGLHYKSPDHAGFGGW